jgi:hypothetical protein
VVVIGGSCVRGFRTSGIVVKASSSRIKVFMMIWGWSSCVYPWVHTDTIIIIIMHHSSSSLIVDDARASSSRRGDARA